METHIEYDDKKDPVDGLPDEDVTGIDEIPVYSINKPKPESLVVLKILDSMREGGRPKMMKKGRLIEEIEEAGIIDKNAILEANNVTTISAAIPIHEEDASNVVGEITEGGIEVDPERLPSTLMQFAEYYMAVKSLYENLDGRAEVFDNLDGKFLERLREISSNTRTTADGKATITFKTARIEANYSPDIIKKIEGAASEDLGSSVPCTHVPSHDDPPSRCYHEAFFEFTVSILMPGVSCFTSQPNNAPIFVTNLNRSMFSYDSLSAIYGASILCNSVDDKGYRKLQHDGNLIIGPKTYSICDSMIHSIPSYWSI